MDVYFLRKRKHRCTLCVEHTSAQPWNLISELFLTEFCLSYSFQEIWSQTYGPDKLHNYLGAFCFRIKRNTTKRAINKHWLLRSAANPSRSSYFFGFLISNTLWPPPSPTRHSGKCLSITTSLRKNYVLILGQLFKISRNFGEFHMQKLQLSPLQMFTQWSQTHRLYKYMGVLGKAKFWVPGHKLFI